MMFVERRLQELGRTSSTSLEICFIDLAKAYDSVDRVLLWEVLARFGVPPRMIKVIRMFHDSMRARVQLDDGNFSVSDSVTSRAGSHKLVTTGKIGQGEVRRTSDNDGD